jgi:polar amino acid transport system substrate-binding protein
LRDALQQALKALIADGSYGRILARHGIERGAVKAAVINGGKDLKW